ncbi:cold-shock protein [Roseomonas populi]|uniref:Cold shock domain-containing protein n=1 Tax=Roseomonas populi TaxID=3121582 RepID=A0ABT1X9G2_9PROT|nr:cold shock domain-containing protein [Roseomonas pecuniae]MCR0984748.1 cold shock domain-containing protein [Roseomonas pecuniae]
MPTGTVVWYQPHKGYGFIRPDDGGPDVMVHESVVEAAGRRDLKKGEEIEYEAAQLPKKPAPIVTRILSR